MGVHFPGGSVASAEPIVLELPALGSKFIDRDTFLTEAIALLKELAEVIIDIHVYYSKHE